MLKPNQCVGVQSTFAINGHNSKLLSALDFNIVFIEVQEPT